MKSKVCPDKSLVGYYSIKSSLMRGLSRIMHEVNILDSVHTKMTILFIRLSSCVLLNKVRPEV